MTSSATIFQPAEAVRRRTGARASAGCLLAVYLVYACSQLGFSAERFSAGLEHGQRFLARMFPPNFSRWQLIASGIVESLQIAVIATFFGILLSLPIGLMAARNLIAALDQLADARLHRIMPVFSSDHRRYPFCQGDRLRCPGRRHGA